MFFSEIVPSEFKLINELSSFSFTDNNLSFGILSLWYQVTFWISWLFLESSNFNFSTWFSLSKVIYFLSSLNLGWE
ncbi:hypothetical protein V2P32_03410 [Mycoplasma sp. 06067-C1-B144P-99-0482-3]